MPGALQVQLLFRRSWRQVSRDRATIIARCMANVSAAIIFGTIFNRMKLTRTAVQDRMGLLQASSLSYFSMTLPSLGHALRARGQWGAAHCQALQVPAGEQFCAACQGAERASSCTAPHGAPPDASDPLSDLYIWVCVVL